MQHTTLRNTPQVPPTPIRTTPTSITPHIPHHPHHLLHLQPSPASLLFAATSKLLALPGDQLSKEAARAVKQQMEAAIAAGANPNARCAPSIPPGAAPGSVQHCAALLSRSTIDSTSTTTTSLPCTSTTPRCTVAHPHPTKALTLHPPHPPPHPAAGTPTGAACCTRCSATASLSPPPPSSLCS